MIIEDHMELSAHNQGKDPAADLATNLGQRPAPSGTGGGAPSRNGQIWIAIILVCIAITVIAGWSRIMAVV